MIWGSVFISGTFAKIGGGNANNASMAMDSAGPAKVTPCSCRFSCLYVVDILEKMNFGWGLLGTD